MTIQGRFCFRFLWEKNFTSQSFANPFSQCLIENPEQKSEFNHQVHASWNPELQGSLSALHMCQEISWFGYSLGHLPSTAVRVALSVERVRDHLFIPDIWITLGTGTTQWLLPKERGCRMPQHIDNTIGNTQLHICGKQRSDLVVSLWEARDRQERICKYSHLEDECDKMHISWKMYVLAVPECVHSSPKCMLSYPNHLKTSGIADGQKIVSQI